MEPLSPSTLPTPVPQLVTSAACARCDVCCRFPEHDSFLRPYFTQQEIGDAMGAGVEAGAFPRSSGAQINLVPNPLGEGYVCPAFDAAANRCGIYERRPLDCRLYPLALMWDGAGEEVLLGWDAKCPFMLEAPPAAIAAHAEQVTALLAEEHVLDAIQAHPSLIGRFQDDVVVLRSLPQVTARLISRPSQTRLRPLTCDEAPRFRRALERAHLLRDDAPAAYAFPFHYLWTSVLPYRWIEIDETFFVFAESPDGVFMPLPPLGPRPLARTVAEAFALMEEWNGPSPVSRIEHVMMEQRRELEQAGWRVIPSAGDYLYRAEALAALEGDRYKSQRALCNRVLREQAVSIDPYRQGDRDACATLLARWSKGKQSGRLEPVGRLLLEDAAVLHAGVWAGSDQLGLEGTVARVSGEVVAYSFGYWLTPHTYCVLLEVADRSIVGLAQLLFRETCRHAAAQGARYINAMDDAGLTGLRDAKRAYRPMTVIETCIVMVRSAP